MPVGQIGGMDFTGIPCSVGIGRLSGRGTLPSEISGAYSLREVRLYSSAWRNMNPVSAAPTPNIVIKDPTKTSIVVLGEALLKIISTIWCESPVKMAKIRAAPSPVPMTRWLAILTYTDCLDGHMSRTRC